MDLLVVGCDVGESLITESMSIEVSGGAAQIISASIKRKFATKKIKKSNCSAAVGAAKFLNLIFE